MKHSPFVKFLAILLVTVCFLTAIGSGLGILLMRRYDLYRQPLEQVQAEQYYSSYVRLSRQILRRYGALQLGAFPEEYYDEYAARYDYGQINIKDDAYRYIIYDKNLNSVYSTYDEGINYPFVWESDPERVSYPSVLYVGMERVTMDLFYDEASQDYVNITYTTKQLDGFFVRLYLTENALIDTSFWLLLTVLYNIRIELFGILAVALLLMIVLLVYLYRSAGRAADGQVRPRGLSRLPLDLYAGFSAAFVFAACFVAYELLDEIFYDQPVLPLLILLAVDVAAMGLVLLGLSMAFAAQLKMKSHYWLKNTLIGRIWGRFIGLLRWFFQLLHRLFRLLPLIWQWFAVIVLMPVLPLTCLVMYKNSYRGEWFWILSFVLWILADLLILVYVPICFGILFRGIQKMRQGDLSARIPTRYLYGCFRDFATELNTLSDTISTAVDQQMRAERTKAELITNVSHDIKTPLTSIVNYVDLLQKPHTEQEQDAYLEVLSRQSIQMKKLIEDLTELSKATTGNIAVNFQTLDLSEAVTQALGEFSDKMDAAGLTPVFSQPEEPILIHADGRLVWRILFNLLSNAVKYAMPGTRVYFQITARENTVRLSIKNISAAPLTCKAEDLLERFVQGDASRHSDGSGLGLNIAKSLMEAQQGNLSLHLDGDLFKVELAFPGDFQQGV